MASRMTSGLVSARLALTAAPWPMDGYVLVLPLGIMTYLVGAGMGSIPVTPVQAAIGASAMAVRWLVGLPAILLLRRWIGGRPWPPPLSAVIVLNVSVSVAVNLATMPVMLAFDAYPLMADRSGVFVTAMNTIMLFLELTAFSLFAGLAAIRSARAEAVRSATVQMATQRVDAAREAALGLAGPRKVLEDQVLPALDVLVLRVQRLRASSAAQQATDVEGFANLAHDVDSVREIDVRAVSRALVTESDLSAARVDAAAQPGDLATHLTWPPVANVFDVRGAELGRVLRSMPLMAPKAALLVQGLLAPWMVVSVPADQMSGWSVALVVSFCAAAVGMLVASLVASRIDVDALADDALSLVVLSLYALPAAASAFTAAVLAPIPSSFTAALFGIGLFADVLLTYVVIQHIRVARQAERLRQADIATQREVLLAAGRGLMAVVRQATWEVAEELHSRVQARLAAVVGTLMAGVRSEEFRIQHQEALAQAEPALAELAASIRETMIPRLDPERYLDADLELRADLPLETRIRGCVFDVAPAIHAAVSVDDGIVLTADQRELVLAAIREGSSDAVRHGKAASLDIRLRRDGVAAVLMVDDDGVGLPDTYTPGLGSAVLDRRSASCDATWSRGGSLMGGARLLVHMPLMEVAHA